MGITNAKGELGEAMVLADLQRKGYGVAIPFGHDLPFDLILIRKETGDLERVQCKYTRSDGRVIDVRCQSYSAWVHHTYGAHEVDWIAVYDATTDCCYYVHSSIWAGLTRPRLRLVPAANGQRKGTRRADQYLYPDLHGREPPSGALDSLGMLVAPSPE
jgi:PD-(D/E)XK endonuclease